MANIARIRVALTGAIGLPGVSTFYALDPVTAVPALRAFYLGNAGIFPNLIHIYVEPYGDTINESNGEAVASWSTTAVAEVVGTKSGTYAAPVGACITWVTGSFIGGRRVRGRTFMVPAAADCFESDGTLVYAVMAGLRETGQELIDAVAGNMLVYHRETAEDANDGTGVAIASVLVNDKAAVLRSRRD